MPGSLIKIWKILYKTEQYRKHKYKKRIQTPANDIKMNKHGHVNQNFGKIIEEKNTNRDYGRDLN